MAAERIAYLTVIRLIRYGLLFSCLAFWVSFYIYPEFAVYMKTSGVIVYMFVTVILVLWLDDYMDDKPSERVNRLIFFTLFTGSTIMSRIVYGRMDSGDHEILLVITASLPYMLYIFFLFRKLTSKLTIKSAVGISSLFNGFLFQRIAYLLVMGSAFLLGYGTHILLEKIWGNPA
ncbi:hypothetical protein D3P09_21610 [Paenibacillus pinisoli]|uniref:Uncharacterized protein n=1 Tax=Paenibacillus pinisoli TaxID=1276110 RepID=A0A3A6PB22_9BACL|nr:hypothetical protein [Paenibacillus pinisoli]RJX37577.1 hypothetical protein D3P09_21610 [Paenibacillus pinisoli]